MAIKQVSIPKNVEKEIEILQGLDHPNIVKYIDHYRQGGFIYIVFEYVENGSLRDVIEKFGAFPESLVVRSKIDIGVWNLRIIRTTFSRLSMSSKSWKR